MTSRVDCPKTPPGFRIQISPAGAFGKEHETAQTPHRSHFLHNLPQASPGTMGYLLGKERHTVIYTPEGSDSSPYKDARRIRAGQCLVTPPTGKSPPLFRVPSSKDGLYRPYKKPPDHSRLVPLEDRTLSHAITVPGKTVVQAVREARKEAEGAELDPHDLWQRLKMARTASKLHPHSKCLGGRSSSASAGPLGTGSPSSPAEGPLRFLPRPLLGKHKAPPSLEDELEEPDLPFPDAGVYGSPGTGRPPSTKLQKTSHE